MNRKFNYFFVISVLSLAFISSSLLTIRVITMDKPKLDQWSSSLAQQLDGTTLFEIFRWITELGSGTFLIPFSILIALFLWVYRKAPLAAAMVVTGTLFGYKVNAWLKWIIARERPRILAEAEGVGYSFPSGHAMVALIAYGLFIFFLIKHTKTRRAAVSIHVIGIVLILLIGLSRYVIRVHYITDVLAGFSFGSLFLLGWIGLYQLLSNIKIAFFSVSRRRGNHSGGRY